MELVKSLNTNKISSEIIMDYIDIENNDISYEVLELLKVLKENKKNWWDNYNRDMRSSPFLLLLS